MNKSKNILSLNLFHKKETRNCDDRPVVSGPSQSTNEEPLSGMPKYITLNKTSSCLTGGALSSSLQQPPPCDYIFIQSNSRQTSDKESSKMVHFRGPRVMSEHRCDVDMDPEEEMNLKQTSKYFKGLKKSIRHMDSVSVLTCEDMTTSSQSSVNKMGSADAKKHGDNIKGSWDDKEPTKLIWI